MKTRIAIDIDALIRSIILLGFILLFADLIITGQITLYINPRFVSMTELVVFFLIPLFLLQAVKIVNTHKLEDSTCCHSHSSRWAYLPFIITLLLAFQMPATSLDAKFVANKGLNSQVSSKPDADLSGIARPLAKELAQSEAIQVTDKNYAEVMWEINLFPADYTGKEITMTGFVYKSSSLLPDQLALARYVVSCCSADARPYGILCEIKEAGDYKENQWLQVRGIVQIGKYKDRSVAMVKVVSATQIQPPENPYAFPLAQ